MVQAVIGSSSLVFEPTPASVSRVDRSHFYVVAWAVHPDLISAEVSGVLPKPKVPFVEGEPPLFPWASKIIHSKRDTLQYGVLVHVLEVHDFTPLADSDDATSSDSSDSSGDGIPKSTHSSLQPWPHICRLAGPVDDRGRPLPPLPQHGGGATWPALASSSSPFMSCF
jgi:hypothetical protein